MKIAAVLTRPRKARVEMLPLIDIVFLLLVFFIYAMLSMAVHRGLPVELPDSKVAMTGTGDLHAVTIKGNGTLFLDQEEIRLDELTERLQAISVDSGLTAAADKPGLLLYADRRLAYEELYQVLDRIQLAGITNISLQADGQGR